MHRTYMINSSIEEQEKAQFLVCLKTLTLALARSNPKIYQDLIPSTVGLRDCSSRIRASVAPAPNLTMPRL